MSKTYKRYDDHTELFENGTLKDTERMRVPMYMCDSLQKSVAQTFADVQLTDEQLALHRPGYRIGTTDTAARDARIARAEYIYDLENSYKNPMHAATGAREGDQCSIDGSPGHLRMVDGKLTCTPDQTQDAMTTDMAEVYAAYAAEISQRWRG